MLNRITNFYKVSQPSAEKLPADQADKLYKKLRLQQQRLKHRQLSNQNRRSHMAAFNKGLRILKGFRRFLH